MIRTRYLPVLLLMLGFFTCFTQGCATYKLGKAGQQKTAGKTYVIVGASSGFGRGVAEQLGAYKANVVLAARRTDLLEEIAGKVRAAGGTALVVTADISNPEDLQKLEAAAIKQYGTIDVWINMAGIGALGYFWEIPPEDQARVVDVNFKGILSASYIAINRFRKQGYGTLVNMGSGESVNPLAYHTTYAATKAAVLSMGESLNQELRLSGNKHIHVVTVEPWATDTPFWRHSGNYTGKTQRMVLIDPPAKVVNAVIRSSIRPRTEVPVGWKSHVSRNFHRMMPRLTERLSANVIHNQIRKAPLTENTSGSIHQPMKGGRGVEDGVRARIKKENKERRKR